MLSSFCSCPREESNLDYKIRNLASCPLNDEGMRDMLLPLAIVQFMFNARQRQ